MVGCVPFLHLWITLGKKHDTKVCIFIVHVRTFFLLIFLLKRRHQGDAASKNLPTLEWPTSLEHSKGCHRWFSWFGFVGYYPWTTTTDPPYMKGDLPRTLNHRNLSDQFYQVSTQIIKHLRHNSWRKNTWQLLTEFLYLIYNRQSITLFIFIT